MTMKGFFKEPRELAEMIEQSASNMQGDFGGTSVAVPPPVVGGGSKKRKRRSDASEEGTESDSDFENLKIGKVG